MNVWMRMMDVAIKATAGKAHYIIMSNNTIDDRAD